MRNSELNVSALPTMYIIIPIIFFKKITPSDSAIIFCEANTDNSAFRIANYELLNHRGIRKMD